MNFQRYRWHGGNTLSINGAGKAQQINSGDGKERGGADAVNSLARA